MRPLFVLALTAATACFVPVGATSEAPGSPGGGGGIVGESPQQKAMNQSVMTRLEPACGRCHGPGSNKPFFASLDAFETLLVFNSRYVVAGNPERGELLPLLRGAGTGASKQMPLSGDTFEALAAKGATEISMAELVDWIAKLNGDVAFDESGANGIVQQRLDAEHIQDSMLDQLGLTQAEFWQLDPSGAPSEANVEAYPMRAPDELPMNPSSLGHANTPYAAWGRYTAMGGPNHLARTRKRSEVSPTFMLNFVQTAQTWCGIAVAKPGNTAVLGVLGEADTAASNLAGVRANIARLYLRMIGEPAGEPDVDALFAVYTHYETQSVPIAWTATCASILRNPLWLTY